MNGPGKYKNDSSTSVQLIRCTVLVMFKFSSSVFSALVLSVVAVSAYDPTRNDNVSVFSRTFTALYTETPSSWSSIGVCASRSLYALVFILLGQNSYGATHPSDPANWQQTISNYCQVPHLIARGIDPD